MKIIKSIESISFLDDPCMGHMELPPHWEVVVKIEGCQSTRELHFSDSPEGENQAKELKVGDLLPEYYN